MFKKQREETKQVPIEVDISTLEAGTMTKIDWQGTPVWVVRRTPEQLATLRDEGHRQELNDPDSQEPYKMDLPAYAQNPVRARADHEDVAVLVGICPHSACKVHEKAADAKDSSSDAWPGGFLCHCHRSRFDLAGRVYKNKPSKRNLDVPPHMFQTSELLIIGQDEDGEA